MKFKPIVDIVVKRVLPPLVGVAVLVVSILVAGKFVKATIEWRERIQPGEEEVDGRRLPAGQEQKIYVVDEVQKQYYNEAVGTLKAASRTEIASRILAPINQINVSAGEMVEEGDVLIVLDGQRAKTKLSQAQAALAAARSDVDQAQDDFKRATEARSRLAQAVSEEAYNQLASKVRVAHANYNVAQQALAEAGVLLSYTTIKAPKAGMVVDRLAEPGDLAQPGVPLLVLYDPTSLRLEVPVMEDLAVGLKPGDILTVHIDAVNRDVEATIDEIVPQAQAASRSFLVKVRLPRSEGLFEGMAGRLLIPAGVRRHLCLNTAAIERVGQLEFVDVVGDDGRLQRRMIKTGRLGMPGKIEVLGGLRAGERVWLKHPDRAVPYCKDVITIDKDSPQPVVAPVAETPPAPK